MCNGDCKHGTCPSCDEYRRDHPRVHAPPPTSTRTLGGVDMSHDAYDVATTFGLTDRAVRSDLDKLITRRTTPSVLYHAYIEDDGDSPEWRQYIDALEVASKDSRQIAGQFARGIARREYERNGHEVLPPQLDDCVDIIWSHEHTAALAMHLDCDVAGLTSAELDAARAAYAAAVTDLQTARRRR